MWEPLYIEYFEPLSKFAFGFINDFESSKDLVQDVFINLQNKYPDRSKINNPKALLFKSVKNLCLTRGLSHKRKTKALREIAYISDDTCIIKDEYYDFELIMVQIKELVDTLPKARQKIFKMKYYDQLPDTKIAEILGISYNTVRSQMGRSVDMIRQSLKHIINN